ncbi:uncharacterized protein ColSpa_07655 [Colletotrichum spaethianum]|uniref:Fungal N-terminal domain-containing protein n=1 Tax=Colletotrichum spaethianum TaxID=700344 RepID=A0AA37UI73_9PEZI|nr:uncharacterized protein ColSpa_07655 [Colletotrichum spaethianum]GKT47474.1 hypothetical protein ColSpa_07655 [Colletotrichum spaethianum]
MASLYSNVYGPPSILPCVIHLIAIFHSIVAISFGWSAGGIAAATKLLCDVYQALDDCSGASGDYRDAVAFLKSLTQILDRLKAFSDRNDYPAYNSEIREQVKLIKPPVDEFINSTQKYDKRLGNTVKDGRFRHIVPKIKWHFLCSKNVLVLRKRVNSHVQILNTLMIQSSLYVPGTSP